MQQKYMTYARKILYIYICNKNIYMLQIYLFIVNSKNMSNLIGREEAYKSRISYFTCKI